MVFELPLYWSLGLEEELPLPRLAMPDAINPQHGGIDGKISLLRRMGKRLGPGKGETAEQRVEERT